MDLDEMIGDLYNAVLSFSVSSNTICFLSLERRGAL